MNSESSRREKIHKARRFLNDACIALDRASNVLLTLSPATREDRGAIADIENTRDEIVNITIWESGDGIDD